MRSRGAGVAADGIRWAIVFALILLAAIASPVLADEPSEEGPIEGPDLSQIEQEERERSEWLEGPEAAQQREESRTAFKDLSVEGSKDLLLQAFPAQLEALNADPARALSELEIEEPLGTYGALIAPEGEGEEGGTEEGESEEEEDDEDEETQEIVESEEGTGEIVESSVPVESDLGGKGEKPVDLALESEGPDFAPENPLTDLTLPGTAEGPIELRDGLEVQLPSTGEHEAQALGEMNLFYPETETSTDALVSPIAGGVEIFEQLRSPESPEQFRFELGLPSGASLRARDDGGAEILSSSEDPIAQIPPPSALDAQGVAVPVTMGVQEDSLVLEIRHASEDFAYPILLDPTVEEERIYHIKAESPPFDSADWRSSALDKNYAFERGIAPDSSRYLRVATEKGRSLSATDGQWIYTAPGQTAYIQQADFGNIHFGGCTYPPYGYLSLHIPNPEPGETPYVGFELYKTNGTGMGSIDDPGYSTGKVGYSHVREAMIGVGTWEKLTTQCETEMKLHAITLIEGDLETPKLSVSGLPGSGWFDPNNAGSVTMTATDPGFGVKEISIGNVGDLPSTYTPNPPCSGLSGHRCPAQLTWGPTHLSYLDGERTFKITAEDPLQKVRVLTLKTKVDTKAPKIELSGQFAYATEEEGLKGKENEASKNKLKLPTYTLHVEAIDGDPKLDPETKEGVNRQSGVKNIEILLEGKPLEVPWGAQTCTRPAASCPMVEDYRLSLVGLAAGEHKLMVRATDQLGHPREREILFEYIPATGMSDEYVMQRFPLPDGKEGEEEDEAGRPELAVNIMNGNVVYHQRDVEVTGPNLDLNLDRYYNSQLPAEESSEWGEGWTLAQTPKLEVEEAPKEKAQDDKAAIRQRGGLIERAVVLPDDPNAHHFDPKLKAVVTKQDSGRYTLTDASGTTDNTYAFNDAGKTTELRTPGYAKVDYGYEDGDLSEVAVHDPTVFSASASEGPQQPDEFESPAYVDSFGGAESGPGRLSSPAAVAIGPAGDLWVADAGHRRIQRFDSNGAFLDEFGISGSEGGEFLEPRAIAVDSKGNVWVADKSQNKVQKLDAEGKYLSSFGSYGTANGKFTALQGIAIDPEGHVWTVEGGKSKSRVQEFSSVGTYITQFGAAGTADGQLKEPQGIAIDSKGHVWIADTANNRVQEFSSSGTFIRKLGTSGVGQLSSPTALSLDPEGNVWVTDTANSRIVQFSSEGAYLGQLGTAGANKGQFSAPRGVALDAGGRIWVADTANNRIQEFGSAGFLRSFGGQGSEGGNLAAPAATATDTQGNVWVADTAHNRVQEFSSSGEFIRQFGAKGSAAGLFSEPHGIAIDPEGHVWVADTGNYRIQELGSKGEFIRQLGATKGCANGSFTEPRGIAVDPSGHVWTTDAAQTCSRVQEFSSTGTYIRKFGTYGTSYNQLANPKGIAADAKGNVWVADTANNRLAQYTGEGKFIRLVEKAQLARPAGIAVDPAGNLWVADTNNDRIQEFSAEGAYLGQLGTRGNEDGQFNRPEGIATDAKGNLWIADTLNDRVQEVAASQFVRKFGGQGSGIGQLSGPQDVALDSKGDAWIADTIHNRVQEFGPTGAPLREISTADNQSWAMPLGIATDAEDHVWVAQEGGQVIELAPKGAFLREFNGLGETGEADYSSLTDVAVDPDGHVWTLRAPASVQEFSAKGQLLAQFDGDGEGEGQLHQPNDLAVDPEGHLWITDAGDNRVKEFSTTGKFLEAFGGWGVTAGLLDQPSGLSVDAKGNLWVTDTANNRVEIFNAEGTYLGQFGTPGNNYGELTEPQGIATGPDGRVWVADTANNRVQKWLVPQYAFAHDSVYDSSTGAKGSGAGMLRHPAGVAVDDQGNVWVADSENSRVVQYDSQGEFVKTFGWGVNQTKEAEEAPEAQRKLCTAASGDKCQAGWSGREPSQLRRPADVAIDGKGDIWVADMGLSGGRVVRYSPEGQFLSEFETGYYSEPEGIAIAPDGNIWVSRIGASRGWVEEFTPTGKWITTADPFGVASEPAGIDVGPGGNLWIADWEGNQVLELNPEGRFIRRFGTEGTAGGQFRHPDNVFVDNRGQVWVADEGNNRIETFTEQGEYITQLGSKGSGEGQFELEYPAGLATDSKGSLWVADSRHGRLQRFGIYNAVPADETGVTEDAPEVQVQESAEGLVESVEGEEAGETTYMHEGVLLTAVEGPESEADYEYVVVNGMELLAKVTLPNGTWAEVKYDSLGRAEAVSVSIADKTKTTYFEYSEVPRRTVVEPESEPVVTYDIGPDGSVLKWSDAVHPPEIEALGGGLWYQRGEINEGKEISLGDHMLEIPAHSTHGIASIQLVANGDQLVDEKTCEQDPKVSGTECQYVEKTYVTDTGSWSPGIVSFEVIVTDRLGQSSSLRFWDNFPYTPPPDPEVPEPPRYKDVLKFREEHGLDLDIKGNEKAINERIFKLISDWHDPSTREGEVARATNELWGAPLRAVDQAELEYRQQYMEHDVLLIEEWGRTHVPGTFAGVYVDEAAGGLMRVGFTSEQAISQAALASGAGLMAPDRVGALPAAPTRSMATLKATEADLETASEGYPAGLIISFGIDVAANTVSVGATDVSDARSRLEGSLGPGAPVAVTYSEEAHQGAQWKKESGPVFSGDYVQSGHGGGCSAGLGAFSRASGRTQYLLLSAAHCGDLGQTYHRWAAGETGKVLGKVVRSGWGPKVGPKVADGEAIKVSENEAPVKINLGNEGAITVRGSEVPPARGNILCHSGARTERRLCGPVVPRNVVSEDKKTGRRGKLVCFEAEMGEGDSGGPVWRNGTHIVVGLATNLGDEFKSEFSYVTCLTPLYPPAGWPLNEGVLTSGEMTPIHLRTYNE